MKQKMSNLEVCDRMSDETLKKEDMDYIKMKKTRLVEELYDELREKTCLKYLIVDIKKVKSRQEELFQLKEYLPNLIRGFLDGYYKRMEEYGVLDDIGEHMVRHYTKMYTRREEVVEFIIWIDNHREFEDLINEEMLEKLEKELEELETRFRQTLDCLT